MPWQFHMGKPFVLDIKISHAENRLDIKIFS